MLTSVDQILSFVHSEFQIGSNTADDSYLNSLISKNYWARAQRMPWKESIVQNASFTTASTVQTYATSSDFGRLVPNSFRYGVTTSNQNPPNGYFLPIVPFEQYEYYKGVMTCQDPRWVTVTGASSGSGKSFYLFPNFTNSGSVCQYDYYTQPSSLSSTATLPISEIGYVVAYDTLADYATHLKNETRMAQYRAMAQDMWRSSFQNILSTP